jgi:hypothetical protein
MMFAGGFLVLVGLATWIGCALLIVFTLLGYWQHCKEVQFATKTADALSAQVNPLLADANNGNVIRGQLLNLRISAYSGQFSSGLKNWGLIVDFENKSAPGGGPLYTTFQLLALRYALAIHRDAHSVTDEQFKELTAEATKMAQSQLAAGPLAGAAKSAKFVESYVRGMLVELSWCICHFNGLLNPWFTVLRVFDEVDKVKDEIDFVGVYNSVLPDSIKDRNNGLLAPNGWGG